MANPLGVAIIGGGIFVKEQHLPAVAKCDLLALKAIYSRSLKSAQEAAASQTGDGNPDLYAADAGPGKSFQDLLQRQDVHAVIIALPILSQPQYIEAALAAGKHVLAEKPIAADVTAAKSLIDSYHAIQRNAGGSSTVTLAIAENFRFVPSFVYAREQARHLGKVTHFSVRSFSFTDTESKYYNTEWRKTPEYQGGFLLDGGVHFAAATRQYLGSESAPESVQAITHLTLPYLAPIDSVSAIVKTKTGAVGTYQHSAGTRLNAFEWDIAYEKGSIKQVGEKVTVTTSNGEKTTNEFARSSGVVEEVAAWAQGLIESRPNPFQSPEEALADLEFLEKMFKSGEQNGASQKYELQ